MRYVLAHDLGTSGNKATLFDEQGRLVASVTSAYEMKLSNGTWAEQDPRSWWEAVCSSSKRILSKIAAEQVAVVSFSGQMMACLCVDRKGRALHDALIYCDQRSVKQQDELIDRVGMQRIYSITGHRPSATYTLEKLMWIRDERPEIFRDTYKVLQAKDYMNLRLTGNYGTEYNDASGTGTFDLRRLCWSEEILQAAGIDQGLFCQAVPSTRIIGEVTRQAEAETGIPAGTPVAAGAGDGGCASIGAGSVSFGSPYCYMGSSSWVSVATETPLEDPSMRSFTWAHPVPGLYQPCATMQSAGSALSWFSRMVYGTDDAQTLQELNQAASRSKLGARGVLFLPYLLGERSPWWNPDAKAEFFGMSLETSRDDLARAVIEGIAMNLMISLGPMLSATGESPVTFIGGGAQGAVLRRIFCDVFGVDLRIPTYLTEATSMGAALIGGVAAGLYKDFSFIERMNPLEQTLTTDRDAHESYQELTKRFEELYRRLEPLF